MATTELRKMPLGPYTDSMYKKICRAKTQRIELAPNIAPYVTQLIPAGVNEDSSSEVKINGGFTGIWAEKWEVYLRVPPLSIKGKSTL